MGKGDIDMTINEYLEKLEDLLREVLESNPEELHEQIYERTRCTVGEFEMVEDA